MEQEKLRNESESDFDGGVFTRGCLNRGPRLQLKKRGSRKGFGK